jgi:hypothetical protein
MVWYGLVGTTRRYCQFLHPKTRYPSRSSGATKQQLEASQSGIVLLKSSESAERSPIDAVAERIMHVIRTRTNDIEMAMMPVECRNEGRLEICRGGYNRAGETAKREEASKEVVQSTRRSYASTNSYSASSGAMCLFFAGDKGSPSASSTSYSFLINLSVSRISYRSMAFSRATLRIWLPWLGPR